MGRSVRYPRLGAGAARRIATRPDRGGARPGVPSRAGATLIRLARDERGVITVMAAIATGLFVAIGGLALDLGRLYNLHSQLQAYADHVALAAAAELDGQAGAIERARRAALGDGDGPMLADVQTFAVGAPDLRVLEPVFLRALPADPLPQYETSDLVSYVTTEDSEARFVWVTVEPREMRFLMLPMMNLFADRELNTGESATTNAVAVAGFTREVCNFPPMMMCNPYETAGNKEFTPIIGQQILLKAQGESSWAPGDFGLLDTVEGAGEGECTGGLGGANRIRCVMALINPNSQCVGGRVNIRPGQAMAVHAGLNVRFDIWDPPLQNKRTDPDFAPAANVTKGMSHAPNQCRLNSLTPAPDTVPLPRDGCFESGTCDGGRFGDVVSTARLSAYWSANHGGAALPGELTGGTRYDVYRYEIDQGEIPLSADPNGENGAPSCAPSGYDNPLLDRRVLIVAVINCIEQNIHGNRDDVPVVAFAKMFLTEPAGDSPSSDLYAEMLGVLEPGGKDGVLHDFPQLYR
jgi:Putative Flp pilus-assembly TadE/G-like